MSAAYDWDLQAHNGPQQFAEHPPEAKGSKRSRQTYSKYQTAVLETVFQTSKYIVRSKRQQMSAELNLTERQIKIWFQNRRMKEKKCGSGQCKESPPVDDHCDTMVTMGYVDDYAISELGTAGYHATAPICDVTDFCHRTVAGHRPPLPPPQHHDSAGGYTGYGSCSDAGGYDLLAHHEADPYASATKEHHWGTPVVTVDYDQDFFGDHGSDHFQRLPTAHQHHHHHHRHRPLINPQVPDYCQPQLQATHGY